MDKEIKFKEETQFEKEVQLLLQQYIKLESSALSNKIDESLKIIQLIDKTYDSILRDLHFHEIKESDLWLYNYLKHTHKARIGMNHIFDNLTDKLITEINEDEMEKEKFKNKSTKTHLFKKENGIWYIDLPEFIEEGLGTKANLMMVDGADTLLDILSNNNILVTLEFSQLPFVGWTTLLELDKSGKNQELLDQVGHALVDNGAYYKTTLINNVKITKSVWLCPVTEYVFNDYYPENIYIKIIE